jgi:hypothetical protein
MRLFRFILLVVVLTSVWQSGGTLLAAPLPPSRVANHQTRECGEMFAGDECMDCFPPEGWEVLGNAYEVTCPAGYTEIDDEIPYRCEPFKVQFCCSEGHSGAPGDCADLVVNNREKECAFVNEIETCTLPRHWETRPDDVELRSWECPASYEWVEEVACLTESEQAEAGPSLPCLGTLLSGPALILVWLTLRPRR